MMRRTIGILLMVFLVLSVVESHGQTPGNEVIKLILSSYSPRNFSDKPVTDDQLTHILKCGIKAPSARNRQPWKFTVVRDMTKVKDVFRNLLNGNVIILISGPDPAGSNVYFDCALATENMFIAATSLGLGGRIYTGPVGRINEAMLESLQVPEGYRVVSALRIGNLADDADAVTQATSRKEMKEVVNYAE
jgi:nitroreductase